MGGNIFLNMVRVGTVSSVNEARKTARVKFPSLNNMVSGDLHVVQRIGGVTVEKEQLTFDRNGSTVTEEHTHIAQTKPWMPILGDTVLCLYVPVDNGDGYILGVI